jgi:hypothetical protein
MKIVFSLCFASMLAIGAHAKEPYVDLRNVNIQGEVVEVSSPNVLKLEAIQHGKRRHFWVDIIHVDFGELRNKSCAKGEDIFRSTPLEIACEDMTKRIKGKTVQIEVTEWSQPILKGYVFHNQTNLNHELITEGKYPVDYTQTRDANLVVMEKKARCQRVGIWSSKLGIAEEDLKCQL